MESGRSFIGKNRISADICVCVQTIRMFNAEFTKFIENQDAWLLRQHESQYSQREALLARTVKLTEESGEVADAVLDALRVSRKEKGRARKVCDLGSELADVIIVCSLLAKSADIDLDQSITKKMKEIAESE